MVHHCPHTPIIVVGTKIEQREDPETIENLKQKNLRAVTAEQVNIYLFII